MTGCGARRLRSGLVALFALAAILGASVASAHSFHRHRDATRDPGLCDKSRGGEQEGAGGGACCDACLSADVGGLPDREDGFFPLRHEISTRANVALWLGRVTDSTPDNLRSRAPPRPSP